MYSLVSSSYRQKHLKNGWQPSTHQSRRGADSRIWETWVAVGIEAVDRIVEVLLVELLGQGPAEAVEIGDVEIIFLAECCELIVIGDRMKLSTSQSTPVDCF
ncbi:hypothetical protein C451_00920 [Halococcus thailandensis JCM 13552]|uniref:Uncharacterized protein n=1 Tax=Halococcus thailandensis JCM 13552 TaxID=1227457 RepID=M0NFF1_9EURY|nr:hypothetical protein C451_00920 [Halococcus thailandensis JCM 13552]